MSSTMRRMESKRKRKKDRNKERKMRTKVENEGGWRKFCCLFLSWIQAFRATGGTISESLCPSSYEMILKIYARILRIQKD